jgi:hypothetical protein
MLHKHYDTVQPGFIGGVQYRRATVEIICGVVDRQPGWKHHRSCALSGLPTAFTCRAGRKDRFVANYRAAGPFKCAALVRPSGATRLRLALFELN